MRSVEDESFDEEKDAAYGVDDVAGGVLAMEFTGYGDPSNETLARLSADGGVAAVVRSNIQAHERFGYARDGVLVFDSDEYRYVDSVLEYPEEIRELASRGWVDLDGDPSADADGEADDRWIAMAMAESVTGIRITADDLLRAAEGDSWWAPSLVYGGDD